LKDHLDSIVNSLATSNISELSLNSNVMIRPDALSHLFRTINAPRLRALHLSACNIESELAEDIITLLRSPRARDLENLQLNGNSLGGRGVRDIIDAVEQANFTITQLGLHSNDSSVAVEEGDTPPPVDQAEMDLLNYQTTTRLPPILTRNRILTQRVKRTALKTLAPARIILLARQPTNEETARRVIDDVGSRTSSARPFPLLDLPPEVVLQVIRHVSGDATALSELQWARLVREAGDQTLLTKATRHRKYRLSTSDGNSRGKWVGEIVSEIKEGWLRKGGWERWELDRPFREEPRVVDVGVDEEGRLG
jgi:hypothetical protein